MSDAPTSVYTRTASLTDVGSVRSVNQDSCGEFVDDAGYRLLMVADGMGGHLGGEVASKAAIDTVGQIFQRGIEEPAAFLREAIVLANKRVFERSAAEPDLHGMGTTGVALLIGPGRRAWFANVGDSRGYRSRGGRLEVMTQDHSWVHEEVRQNRLTLEEAAVHPRKNVLTRSIGVDPTVEVDVTEVDMEPGDRLLLCSDGLWGEVADANIAGVLDSQEPEQAVRALIDMANDAGGPDNITVQIAVVPSRIGEHEATPAVRSESETTLNEMAAEDTLPRADPVDVPYSEADDPAYEPELAEPRRGSTLALTVTVAAVAALLLVALVWFAIAETGSAPAPSASGAEHEPTRP
jgi:serine/threonine protein phosphatase PrpC